MGTNCSLFGSAGCCASATPAMSTVSMAMPHHIATPLPLCILSPPCPVQKIVIDCADRSLMRKRPEPQFFLRGVPQTRQPAGFNNEKENDQRSKDHQLNIGDQVRGHRAHEQRGGVV